MTKEERLIKYKEKLKDMYGMQRELADGARFVFGIDEAGRGPLCGPVAAACCIQDLSDTGLEESISYLNDSKKMSEGLRDEIYEEIISKSAAYGIAFADEKRIDEINILNATLEAMRDAFNMCLDMYRKKQAEKFRQIDSYDLIDAFDLIPGLTDTIVLVDGNKTVPSIEFRQSAIVKGDAKCPAISAASILAKVSRDKLMLEYDKKYPGYGFAANKGYGTKEHIEAIKRYGILDIHRRSFLKNILKEV